ncbi:AAA family ATPase [Ferrovibrio terrae]|uniref:AAA family ATPase n=1 Tax=Ferrovibrio terrae TaxID=2594003 RepID=A0A516GX09_9PROT|nr:AAA family ATPase [Ferrovibrio terrae]QDO96042.1 AAA family ATPase [Ferrovibrio terrae]
MLNRIAEISNVGRFHKASQKGVELNRFNLFFASNGCGKTTVCAVLRSLASGESAYITERATLGGDASPKVKILTDDRTITFDGAWSATLPNISIFDSAFISENVHAGDYIDRDHRRKQLEVIVGRAGVALKKDVDDLDAAIREKNVEILSRRRDLEKEIKPHGINVDDYLELEKVGSIDDLMNEKAIEIKAAERASEISANFLLNELVVPKIPEGVDEIVTATLDRIAEEAEGIVKSRIAMHSMGHEGERWLRAGVSFIKKDECPFCGQGLRALSLIDAYKAYFGEAYAKFIDEVQKLEFAFVSQLGPQNVSLISVEYSENGRAIGFWGQFLDVKDSKVDISDYPVVIADFQRIALDYVRRKLQNPLSKIELGSDYRSAESGIRDLVDRLGAYNSEVGLKNEKIKHLKAATRKANLDDLRSQFKLLNLQKRRHEPDMAAYCTALQALMAEKVELDERKKLARNRLDVYFQSMTKRYEDSINKYLTRFAADFRMANSLHNYIGGTPSAQYQFLINGHPVDLGDEETPLGQRSFKNTLSAGDKSTLALAFFLAQLDNDPDKAKKIVVFDDPFNSQDRSRRVQTAHLLKKFGSECAQLFLFSHDAFFINELHSVLDAHTVTCQQFVKAKHKTNMSEWDIYQEVQDVYFKQHAELTDFVATDSCSELRLIAGNVRPVLEAHLRYRFPGDFKSSKSLGVMIGVIRGAGQAHALFEHLQDLESVNSFGTKYHHMNAPAVDHDEIKAHAILALELAKGY